jgi:hypothetical protein
MGRVRVRGILRGFGYLTLDPSPHLRALREQDVRPDELHRAVDITEYGIPSRAGASGAPMTIQDGQLVHRRQVLCPR